jgi:hypothetical protein
MHKYKIREELQAQSREELHSKRIEKKELRK